MPTVSDDFTGLDSPTGLFNGATRVGRVTPVGGAAWVDVWDVNWAIASNKGAQNTGGAWLYVETGMADCEVTADLYVGADDDPGMGFNLRYYDWNNRLQLRANWDGWRLERVVDGGSTTLATATPGVSAGGRTYAVKAVLSGALIRVYVDGALIIEAIDATTKILFATKHGLYQANRVTGQRFDNFAATPLPAPVPVADNFDGADGASNIWNSATGVGRFTPVGNKQWRGYQAAAGAGDWGIASNYADRYTSGPGMLLLDPGDPDGTVSVVLNNGSSNISKDGLVFRYVDDNNHVRLIADGDTPGFHLAKVVGGVVTTLLSGGQNLGNVDQALKVSMFGPNFTVTVKGAVIGSAVISEFQTATRIGLLNNGLFSSEGHWNNFSWDPAPRITDPREIEGLVAWYSADSHAADDGQAMTTWYDQSGKGNNATVLSIYTDPPIYRKTGGPNGGPYVDFVDDSRHRWFTLPNLLPTGTQGEIFHSIWGHPTTDGTHSYWPPGAPGWYPYSTEVHESFGADGNRQQFTPTKPVKGYWRRFNVSAIAGSWVARLDNVEQKRVTSLGAPVFSTAPLLGATGGSDAPFRGRMSTVLIYNRVLTPAERIAVDGWLEQHPSGSTKPAVALVSDDFTGPDSDTGVWNAATQTGRITPVGAREWRATGLHNYKLASNHAGRPDFGSGERTWCTVDTAFADGTVECSFRSSGGYGSGITVRYVDPNNNLMVVRDGAAIRLFKMVAGVRTEVGLASGYPDGVWVTYLLKVVLAGTSVKVYVDGALVITATVTEAVLLTGTRHGFVTSATFGAQDAEWDNFIAAPPPPPAPTAVTATARTATSGLVSWTAGLGYLSPTVANGHEVRVDGGTPTFVPGHLSSAVVTGLAPSSTHTVEVRAMSNIVGVVSAWVAAAPFTTFPLTGYGDLVREHGASLLWLLNDADGTPTVLDSSRNGHTGAVVGPVDFGGPGMESTSAKFANGAGIFGNPVDTADDFTIEFAYRYASNMPANPQTLVAMRGPTNPDNVFHLRHQDPGAAMHLLLWEPNGNVIDRNVLAVNNINSNWNHFVLVVKDGKYRIYTGGAYWTGADAVPVLAAPTPDTRFSIGAWEGAGGALADTYAGDMDVVSFYPRALTDDEVAWHYEALTVPDQPPGVPTNVGVDQITTHSGRLYWDDPVVGGPPTNYDVRISLAGVFNGGFETGVEPWYLAGTPGLGSTLTHDTTESHSGIGSLKLVSGTLTGNEWAEAANDWYEVMPQGLIKCVFWAKAAAPQTIQVWPYWGSAPGDWPGFTDVPFLVPITTAWARYEVTWTQDLPAFTGIYFDSVTDGVVYGGGGGSGNTLWLDDITIGPA